MTELTWGAKQLLYYYLFCTIKHNRLGLMEEKSRGPEFYGFTAWVGTWIGFVLFVLWASVPERWIELVGITWYPSRYICLLAGWVLD